MKKKKLKRKSSDTTSSKKEEKSKVKVLRRSPFVRAEENEKHPSEGGNFNDSETDDDTKLSQAILSLVMMADGGRETKQLRRNIETKRILLSHEVESIKIILDQLEKKSKYQDNNENNSNNGGIGTSYYLTDSDLANILLPWTTKHLLFLAGGDNDLMELELLWNLSAKTFQLLVEDDKNEKDNVITTTTTTSFGNIVTQSMIQKLIPFALKCCGGNNDESCNSNAAATVLCLILSHKDFTPKLDFLCESLLVPLAEQISFDVKSKSGEDTSQLGNNGVDIISPESSLIQQKSCEMVAISSMKLLQKKQDSSSLGGVTPKKIFQILANEKVLLAIAKLCTLESDRLRQLIKDVVWKAFFDPVYHLDGFRSLKLEMPKWTGEEEEERMDTDETENDNKQRKIRCYQEMLIHSFQSLARILNATNSSNPMDTAAFGSITVLLGRGFCAQTAAWREGTLKRETTKNRKASSANISTLQFRFLGVLLEPLLRSLDVKHIENSNSLFLSLTQCLDLMLEFDSYHPTYEDLNEQHFSFLKSIQQYLFRLLQVQQGEATKEILKAMQCLIRLNHLVCHGELPGIIAQTALSCARETHSHHEENYNIFLDTLFKTYQQLRQLDYLLHSFVDSYEIFIDSSPPEEVDVGLKSIIRGCHHISNTISMAVASAPYGQIQSLFETFNTWIKVMIENGVENKRKTTLGFFSIVVALFVFLIRNIRVDKHTSREVHSLCYRSLLESVLPLLEQIKQKLNNGIPNKQNVEVDQERFVKDTLLLHGWIIDLQNRCSFWSSSEERVSTEELPSSSYAHIESLFDENLAKMDSGPTLIAPQEFQFLAFYRIQQLHSLIDESEKEDFSPEESVNVDFLREVKRLVDFVFIIAVKISSTEDDEKYTIEDRDQQVLALLYQFLPAWTPYCRNQHVILFLEYVFGDIVGNSNISAVTMLLLQDASFFENTMLHPKFLQVGIQYAQKILQIERATEISGISKELETSTEQHFSLKKTSNASMQGAQKIFMVLNNVPIGYKVCDKGTQMLDSILNIDITLYSKTNKRKPSCNHVDIFIEVRRLFSKIAFESDSSLLDLRNEAWLFRLLVHIMTSTPKLHLLCKEDQNERSKLLLSSSCDLMEATAYICFRRDDSHFSEKKLLRRLVDTMISDHFKFHRVENMLLAAFAAGTEEAIMNDNNQVTIHEYGLCLLNKIRSSKKRCPVKDTSSYLQLVSNIWSFCGGFVDDVFYELLSEYLDVPDKFDKVSPKVLSRIFGIFLKNNAIDRIPKRLRNFILFKKDNSSVEICMICKLLLQSDIKEYAEFLEQILSTPSLSMKYVNMMLLLLRSVNKYENLKTETAKFGQRLLNLAIDSLRLRQDDNDINNVESVSSLLLEIMKHKDMVAIKERDIARLLSQICCLLESIKNIPSQNIGCEIFSSLCELVTTLVQRFPKQLYICVASLIFTIQNFFHFIYSGTMNSEKEIQDAARNLSRLCEMLVGHSEALKKYILGLIFDFIEALSNDLAVTTKKAITPSIYFLLQMTSETEINQLNSLLDPTGRALFRSFYDSYRKRHIYRGT